MSDMQSAPSVCLDASVVVRWLLEDEQSHIESLLTDQRHLVAPTLMRYEVTNALYRLTKAGDLTVSTVSDLIDVLLSLPIEIVDEPLLHGSALRIASRYRSGAAYHAHYVALARHLDAELWTADKRLYNALSPHFGFITLLER